MVKGKLLFPQVPQVPVQGMPLIRSDLCPAGEETWVQPQGTSPVQGEGYSSKLRKNAKAILNMPRLKQSVELAKQTNAKEQFCYHLQQQEPGIIITGQGRCWEFLAVGTETGHESI